MLTYQNPRKHIVSFVKAVFVFEIAAAVGSLVLRFIQENDFMELTIATYRKLCFPLAARADETRINCYAYNNYYSMDFLCCSDSAYE